MTIIRWRFRFGIRVCFLRVMKFFVFYFAPREIMERMKNQSPEEMNDMMKQWFEWGDRCGDSLIEMGGPLMNGRILTDEGNGPSKSDLGSYSILEADSMEDALELLDGHPHLSFMEGCSIEIFETMLPPKM